MLFEEGTNVKKQPLSKESPDVPALPCGIVRPLLSWYAENARPLPWRMAPDPYRVWVSEIMLQQTRVEAVKPYYERFLAAFPDIRALANAPEDVYLKLWEGLGYYSRVRNMHRFAVQVTERFDGVIPSDRQTLLTLPGIGPYTSGAIASIAYGVPVPAVDGNVLRVVTRLTADGRDIKDGKVKASLEAGVAAIIPPDAPGDFNQSLIELGATVCVPNGEAQCDICPIREFCRACAEGTVEQYPVKSAGAVRRIEDRTVLIVTDGTRVLLDKRPETGLLAGLYEFPNVPGVLDDGGVRAYLRTLGLTPQAVSPLPSAKHIFTHIEWHMTGYIARVTSLADLPSPYLSAELSEVRDSYALPSAFAKFRALLPGTEQREV